MLHHMEPPNKPAYMYYMKLSPMSNKLQAYKEQTEKSIEKQNKKERNINHNWGKNCKQISTARNHATHTFLTHHKAFPIYPLLEFFNVSCQMTNPELKNRMPP